MDNELYNLEQSDTTSAQQTLRMVLRFLRLVLRHRLIVIGFVAAAGFIGFVKYKRTPVSYRASAKMMIRNVIYSNTDKEHALAMSGLLASYQQVLLGDTVLTEAAESLEKLPPELQGKVPKQWPAILRDMLNVSFQPQKNIVEISCHSRDPESTANIINKIKTASENFFKDDRNNIARQHMEQLESESKDVTERLAVRRTELNTARQACGDISSFNSSDESHPIVKRLSDLSSQLTESSSQRVELESMLTSIQSLAAAGQDLSQVIPFLEKLLGADAVQRIPGVHGVSQTMIDEMEASLYTLESELLALQQNFGKRHPEIRQRIVKRDQLQQRLNSAHQTNKNKFASGIRDPQIAQWMYNTIWAEHSRISQHQKLLQIEYQHAEEAALTLNNQLGIVRMAERDVETLQKQHSFLLNKLSNIVVSQDDEGISVAALNQPTVPDNPVAPVLTTILGISIVLGLCASLALIYVIDLVDDRLRSPEDVQNQLSLPILGVLRPLPEDHTAEHRIYVHGDPLSVQTECFRTIRTSISLSDSETRCLAITSSEQGEGKTTLTANLAATFAQTGSRTLLIDADMRRPGLSKLLDIRGHGGLSEILRASDNVAEMCKERTVKTEVPGLEVLPCGPRMMNAGILLSMPSLAGILDWAVAEYDQVLVDCPPTLPVSDATIVGNYVDGMLFLLNPEKTHRRSAIRAVDRLRSVGMNVIGAIANTTSEAHSSAYGYGYGYGQEYTYGHDEQDEVDNMDEELDTAIAGKTYVRPEPSQKPYSLLSDSSDTLPDNPERRTA